MSKLTVRTKVIIHHIVLILIPHSILAVIVAAVLVAVSHISLIVGVVWLVLIGCVGRSGIGIWGWWLDRLVMWVMGVRELFHFGTAGCVGWGSGVCHLVIDGRIGSDE